MCRKQGRTDRQTDTNTHIQQCFVCICVQLIEYLMLLTCQFWISIFSRCSSVNSIHFIIKSLVFSWKLRWIYLRQIMIYIFFLKTEGKKRRSAVFKITLFLLVMLKMYVSVQFLLSVHVNDKKSCPALNSLGQCKFWGMIVMLADILCFYECNVLKLCCNFPETDFTNN